MSASLTNTQARNEIMAMFRTAWLAGAFNTCKVFYPNTSTDPLDSTPLTGQTNPNGWVRAMCHNVASRQSTLSGAQGEQRFTRTGIFVAELYAPRGTGLSSSDAMAKIVLDAFEGKRSPSGIWFRDVRQTEIGPDGEWYQVNVVAEFTYDQVK